MTVNASTARDPEARWPRRAVLSGVATSVLALILFACAPQSAPDALPTLSASAVGSGAAGCEPLDLRAPDGKQVELTGQWIADPSWILHNADERTYILQVLDCVWISITDGNYRAEPRPGESYLAQFSGRLTPDFVVTGTLVTVLHHDVPVGSYSQQGAVFPIRFEVEWDPEGRIHLREVPTQLRCLLQTGSSPYCPPATILSVADDRNESPSSPVPSP